MTETIVLYYSKTGSNQFLAAKIADRLGCDMEEIRPNANLKLFNVLGLSTGIKKIKANLKTLDRIILVGPVYMGRFIPPLKSFVNKYKNDIKELVFVSCCGSSYEAKDKKFGHNLVFKEVHELLGNKCSKCVALPIPLILPDEKKEDADAIMKTRLTEKDFNGEMAEKYEKLIHELKL